ncbi:MAG: ABC transporter ATP-binding protein [Selenomonadaceae bacterium]|nr:ABC transporter ATP-binding protein/permease [Selenomonadaceae bacterium]MDD7055599.1 ABC transporter ATP-binding protein [Selenomonadaceae bacterium]
MAKKGAAPLIGPRRHMQAPVEHAMHRKATCLRLLHYFRAEQWRVALLTLIVAVSVAAGVSAPVFMSWAIDAITAAAYEKVPDILLWMFGAFALYAVLLFFQGRLSARLSQSIIRRLRKDLFEKINGLPLVYLDRHPHGDLMSRMTNDADNIATVISTSLGTMFAGLLSIIGTTAVMLSFSVPLTALTWLTAVVTVLMTKYIAAKMGRYFRERQELLGRLNSMVEEEVMAVRTVKAYAREAKVTADFVQTADSLTKTGIRAESIGSSMGPVMNTISNFSFVIVSVFGAYFALRGWITVGVISAFTIYSKQFSRPINEMAQLYGQIETALAGAERIFSVLDEPGERRQGREVPDVVHGDIEFRHVSFSYVPEKRVIDDFSLRIGAGRKIALVGATGSGKTTIVNLLMRFYEIDEGRILLDGQDIRTYAPVSLRKLVGIVLQDTVLFSDTVRYNIAYAKPGATLDEVQRAAEFAHADAFIQHLPQQYDTVLQGAGAGLSAGQRQLLAIARACLASPRILILDEATSNVDTRTEASIQDAMARLMHDRTCLIIAHRLSTIRDADEIIVMDQGRIVEHGRHEELLQQNGRYRALYETQFAGQES